MRKVALFEKFSLFHRKPIFSRKILFPEGGAAGRIRSAGTALASLKHATAAAMVVVPMAAAVADRESDIWRGVRISGRLSSRIVYAVIIK